MATPSASVGGSPREPVGDDIVAPVQWVSDGDTITVAVEGRYEKVRFLGIDAPEVAGGCYAAEATAKVKALVAGQSVRLLRDPTQADRDRYGRLVRSVYLTDGTDVGEVLVRGGFAIEYTYAAAYGSQAKFRAAQEAAKAESAGLWGACPLVAGGAAGVAGGGSVGVGGGAGDGASAAAPLVGALGMPASPAAPAPEGTQGCQIKGNISAKGERIFHVPGQRDYDKTMITEGAGERWFCSEQEALDAGWRKALR